MHIAANSKSNHDISQNCISHALSMASKATMPVQKNSQPIPMLQLDVT